MVGDVKHASLEAEAEPHLYVPYHQTHRDLLVWLTQNQFLVVRAAGPARSRWPSRAARAAGGRPERGLGRRPRQRRTYVERRPRPRALQPGAAGALRRRRAASWRRSASTASSPTRWPSARARPACASRWAPRPRTSSALVLGEGLRRTRRRDRASGWSRRSPPARASKSLLFGVGATDPATYAAVVVAAAGRDACRLPAARLARRASRSRSSAPAPRLTTSAARAAQLRHDVRLQARVGRGHVCLREPQLAGARGSRPERSRWS